MFFFLPTLHVIDCQHLFSEQVTREPPDFDCAQWSDLHRTQLLQADPILEQSALQPGEGDPRHHAHSQRGKRGGDSPVSGAHDRGGQN